MGDTGFIRADFKIKLLSAERASDILPLHLPLDTCINFNQSACEAPSS